MRRSPPQPSSRPPCPRQRRYRLTPPMSRQASSPPRASSTACAAVSPARMCRQCPHRRLNPAGSSAGAHRNRPQKKSAPHKSILPSYRPQVKPCPHSAPTIFAPISIRGWRAAARRRPTIPRQERCRSAQRRCRQNPARAQIARRGDQPHSRLRQRWRAPRAARGGGLAESRCDAASHWHRPRAGGKTRANRSRRPHAWPGRHLRPARDPALARASAISPPVARASSTSSGSMPRRPCR